MNYTPKKIQLKYKILILIQEVRNFKNNQKIWNYYTKVKIQIQNQENPQIIK